MIWKFLAFFDLFRQPILFYYDGWGKRTSTFGILSSLIIYLYLFYSFFQSDLFNKTSPYVITQDIQTTVAEKMQFDENRWVGLTVSDVYANNYLDPSIFRIEFRYFLNASYYEVRDLHVCTLEDANGNQTFYDDYEMNQSY